jgi:hypothetical protein
MKLDTHGFSLELLARRTVDDEDWVRVQVVAAAPGFTGDFEAWLELNAIQRFKAEVQSMYEAVGKRGTATLGCAEPDISVELEMQPLGGILGTYRLESERLDGGPTVLSGAFSLDQSYLPGLVESLESLVAELQSKNAP